MWATARAQGLSAADAADVSQTTWMRLAEHLHRLRRPEAVGAWLATTARHEALRVKAGRSRQVPTEDLEIPDEAPPADLQLVEAAEDGAVWDAFARLSERCRQLLRALLADPPPTYAELSAALGIPVGSIGPTRARCLAQLRQLVARSEASGGVIPIQRRARGA